MKLYRWKKRKKLEEKVKILEGARNNDSRKFYKKMGDLKKGFTARSQRTSRMDQSPDCINLKEKEIKWHVLTIKK